VIQVQSGVAYADVVARKRTEQIRRER
jgi:hypothetical protein